jgi:hypothetical protein
MEKGKATNTVCLKGNITFLGKMSRGNKHKRKLIFNDTSKANTTESSLVILQNLAVNFPPNQIFKLGT